MFSAQTHLIRAAHRSSNNVIHASSASPAPLVPSLDLDAAHVIEDDSDDDDDDDDGLSLVEGSDNEDLISLDGELPDGLIAYDGSDVDDDDEDDGTEGVWGGISKPAASGTKRKRDETKSEKRKKLRSLPTFASYEDYAKMIEDGPEDFL